MIDDFSISSILIKAEEWEEFSESEETGGALDDNDLWSIPGLVHTDQKWIAMETSDAHSNSGQLIGIPVLQDSSISEPMLAKSCTCNFNANSKSTLARACRPYELEEVEKVRSGPVKLPEASSSMAQERAFQQLYTSQLQRLSDCMLRSQISRIQIMRVEKPNFKKNL